VIAPDITPLFRLFAKWRLQKLLTMDGVTIQAQNLAHLLAKAQNTRFGKDHAFATIKTVADYQKAVPLRRYEDLWRDYWQSAFPVCKYHLAWQGTVFRFDIGHEYWRYQIHTLYLGDDTRQPQSRLGYFGLASVS